MKGFWTALAISLLPSFSFAQGAVQQSGPVVPGHVAAWGYNGILVDGGPVYGTGISALFASPPCIGCTTPNAGAFTTLSATGAITGAGDGYVVGVTGADPTGVVDSAPAFRAAMGSNRTIIVPPGTYRFSSTVAPGCCALDNAAVRVSGYSNFALIGYGVTITIDPSIALSTAFQFDSDTNFQVAGFSFVGNRTGLSASAENVGVTLINDINFHVTDLNFKSGFFGVGAAFAGDWLVDGAIDHIEMTSVGQCSDLAFLKNIDIAQWRATGGGGASTLSGVGQKCISFVNDTPNTSNNLTGISYTQTDGVTVRGIEATNFATGAFISSGVNYTLTGNRWSANPGISGAAEGIGIYIAYVNGGSFTSVGFPPGNILINGDTMDANGTAQSGAGLLISQAAIANSDVISNITVVNSIFNNNTAIGFYADGVSHLSNIQVANNTYYGAAQTTGMDSTIAAFALLAAKFTTLNTTGNAVIGGSLIASGATYIPNNYSIYGQNAANTLAESLMFIDASNVLNLGYGVSGTPIATKVNGSLSVAGAITGASVEYFGPGSPSSNWMNTLRTSTSISNLSSVSTIGKIASVGGSRCSDNPNAGDMGCIGGEFFVNNDNTSYVQYAWGIYGEARRQAGAGTTQHEIDIANLGSVVDIAPASGQTVGNTFGLNIASGAELGGATDVSAGLLFWNNGAAFRKGIVFGNTSLTSTGGYQSAIAFASGNRMEWYDASNAITGFITDAATTHVAPMGLVFADGFTYIVNNSLAAKVTFSNTGVLTAASYVAGSTSGVSCSGTPTSSFASIGGIVTHC